MQISNMTLEIGHAKQGVKNIFSGKHQIFSFSKTFENLHSMFVLKIVCSRGIYCASKIGLITGQTFAIMPFRFLRLAGGKKCLY